MIINPTSEIYDTNRILSNIKFNPSFIRDTFFVTSPYIRPIAFEGINVLDFLSALPKEEYLSPTALCAQKLLTSFYETDMLFLPNSFSKKSFEELDAFYSSTNKITSSILRPILEKHVFGFLTKEVEISGHWTIDLLKEYLEDFPRTYEQTSYSVVDAILNSKHPDRWAKEYIIQVAVDFLTEASALARVNLGNAGEVHSELFKILIDEFGYGVHKTKHSSLFQRLLTSLDLSKEIHYYWNFYLSSSLGVHNYLHATASDQRKFFKYVGIVYSAEATFSHTCAQLSKMLKEIFSDKVDTAYFDEHVEIDRHHCRMSYENILVPMLNNYGTHIIPYILSGFEEFKIILELNDLDFIEQMHWGDSGDRSPEAKINLDTSNKFTTSRVNRTDVCLHMEKGTATLIKGYNNYIPIETGEKIIIPKNRLYSLSECDEINHWSLSHYQPTASFQA